MAKADRQSTAEIATALGYPTEPIKMYLENLAMLHVCKRDKEGTTYRWTMNKEFCEIIRKYEGVHKLTEEEIKERLAEAENEEDDRSPEALALDEAFPDPEENSPTTSTML
jgi:hypothetical protein